MKALFVDFDGTLCDSSHAREFLPPPGEAWSRMRADSDAWTPWYDALRENCGVPIPAGIARAVALAKETDGAVVVLTSRSELIATETRKWLYEHARELVYPGDARMGAHFSFRQHSDVRSSVVSKIARLTAFLCNTPGITSFEVLDDDYKMEVVEKLGGTFHRWEE